MRLRNGWKIIAVVASMLVALVAIPAGAQTSDVLGLTWADQLPDSDAVYQPITHGDGAVSVLYGDSAGLAVKTVGNGREQFSTTHPVGKGFGAIGKNGDAYFTAPSSLTAQASNGVVRWSVVLPDICGRPASLTSLNVGVDGSLYGLVMPSDATRCAGSFQLVKYDALNGTNIFTKLLGDLLPEEFNLAAYKSGVVLVAGSTVRYFNASGMQTSSFVGSSADVQVNADGVAIYTLSHSATAADGCVLAAAPVLDGLLLRATNGAQVRMTLHDCVQAFSVQPLSNGGALINELAGSTATLVAVNSVGGISWRKTYPGISGQTSRVGYLTTKSDGNGNVIVVQQMDTNGRSEVDVQVLSAVTGVVQNSYNTSALDAAASFSWASPNGYPDAIGIAPNRLYLALRKCITPTSCVASLYAFNLNGLALDYPRSAVWGNGGQSPAPTTTPLQMVVLGDSFSSGEGVEPFDPKTAVGSGKSMNLCHRSDLAYAHDVVKDLSTVRLAGFFACSGATTKEVLDNAQYSNQPRQIDSLKKVKNVGVVTLTIGGNDIAFRDFAIACVQKSDSDCARRYKASSQLIKNNLPDALKKTYAALQSSIGTKTLVLVLGYPTLVTYDPSNACSFPTVTALDAFKRTLAISLEDQLNLAIKQAVKQAGKAFVFVDAASSSSPFWGHELCSNDPYFNGPTLLPGVEYSFHPNARGQRAYAQLVVGELVKKGMILH